MSEMTQLQQAIQAAFPQTELRMEEPLAQHTSFRIGGPCEVMAFPRSVEELSRLLRWAHGRQLQPAILGSGTNVLAADAGRRHVPQPHRPVQVRSAEAGAGTVPHLLRRRPASHLPVSAGISRPPGPPPGAVSDALPRGHVSDQPVGPVGRTLRLGRQAGTTPRPAQDIL